MREKYSWWRERENNQSRERTGAKKERSWKEETEHERETKPD